MKNPHSPPSKTASHDAVVKPSILLALVCLAVVHRLRPEWISVTLDAASRSEGMSPQRLSRLCSRAIALFQKALDTLTRIGRPTKEKKENSAARDNALLRSLLGVATSILGHFSFRRPAIRALVIGAFLRLKQEHPELTKTRFCEAIALSERTFRHWMANRGKTDFDSPIAPQKKPRQPPKRPPRRPRFGFQVTLPDTQVAADTTDIEAFGVPLKLVAAQDVGGRDQDLLDAVVVDEHENAKIVVQAITEAVGDKQGQQVLTDQGTPYMAEATRKALEELKTEHAPQKEGDPQGKATIERAFGSIKQIAGPLFNLTNRVAEMIPALRKPDIAKAVAILVLTAILKAYQAGARAARRADDERTGVSSEKLADLAEQSREKARAEARSKRLMLTAIHRDYKINRPLNAFIRAMRRFPLPVLKEAELAFSMQAHRDDIKDRAAYFAAIATKYNEPYQQRQAAERRQKEEDERRERVAREIEARNSAWQYDPAAWLYDAFDTLSKQWLPNQGKLLFGGAGIGKAWLCDSIQRLTDTHGPVTAIDIAQGVFSRFNSADPNQIGPAGLLAISNLFEKHLPTKPTKQTDCKIDFGTTILRNNGPPQRPKPRGPC